MPKSTSGTSKGADERLSNDHSVYDYLYYDSRRIGSYLSQFDPDGHLQLITRGKTGSRGKKDTSTREGKGGIPGVAEGGYTGSTETAVDMSHGYERVFDPMWVNARTFLDHLSENDLIQRDLSAAIPGQFVLATGFLNVLDLMMMKEAWKLPGIQRAVKAGIIQSGGPKPITAAQKAAEKERRDNADAIFEMLQIMPHSIHATLLTSQGTAFLLWCALREEHLSMPASEVVMTHGGTVQGDWTILGVLNARPDFRAVDNLGKTVNADLDAGIMDSMVGRASTMLAPMVRIAAGRPANAHAVTPLLIFREVAVPVKEDDRA